jgi:hypothetical protein
LHGAQAFIVTVSSTEKVFIVPPSKKGIVVQKRQLLSQNPDLRPISKMCIFLIANHSKKFSPKKLNFWGINEYISITLF